MYAARTRTDLLAVSIPLLLLAVLLSFPAYKTPWHAIHLIPGLALLAAGRIPVMATSRSLVVGGLDDPDGLRLARRVSAMLVGAAGEVVAAGAPAWLVAKGGITSSDVATRALGAKRATVLGQVVAGVPVWRVPGTTGQGAMTLVVFPGNVGDDRGLRDVVATLVAAGSVSA